MRDHIKFSVFLFFIFLLGCIKEEDDLGSQNCEIGCTMVTGRILTENGQVPFSNLKIVVVWSKGGYGFGLKRTKATTKTDSEGNFSLKFEIRDDELKEGGFGITYSLDKDEYLDSNRGIPLYHVKRDTTLVINYNIPRKAFLDISVLNTDIIEQGETFYTDLSYITPSGLEQPVDGYILSWNNHHHLMHASNKVNGKVLWANLHLLFWLSLLPFATGFMGVNHFEKWPTAIYGFVLLLASISWNILYLVLKGQHDEKTIFRQAYGNNKKVYISIGSYSLATGLSFISPMVAVAIYMLVAVIWLLPNKNIEKEF